MKINENNLTFSVDTIQTLCYSCLNDKGSDNERIAKPREIKRISRI